MDDYVEKAVRPIRISVLNVPVDILNPDDIDPYVKHVMSDGKNHHIILLSVWDLMKARRNAEYRALVSNAALVLPVSQSILKGAKFLRRDVPYRYMPFEFVISLLRALERWGKSAYMFGARRNVLLQAEKNIRQTFPGLKIVGRYQGFYPKAVEEAVIEAIRKSSPTLLMVGTGVPGREKWIRRNMKKFQAGIYLWISDCFEVFAEKRRRVSRKTFSKGLEFVPYTLRRPWKVLRFFVFSYYKMLLLIYRLRKL